MCFVQVLTELIYIGWYDVLKSLLLIPVSVYFHLKYLKPDIVFRSTVCFVFCTGVKFSLGIHILIGNIEILS